MHVKYAYTCTRVITALSGMGCIVTSFQALFSSCRTVALQKFKNVRKILGKSTGLNFWFFKGGPSLFFCIELYSYSSFGQD